MNLVSASDEFALSFAFTYGFPNAQPYVTECLAFMYALFCQPFLSFATCFSFVEVTTLTLSVLPVFLVF